MTLTTTKRNVTNGNSCRFGEDCVSQDKCPEFLHLKEQLNIAAKGAVQYNRLLNRSALMVARCLLKGQEKEW